MSGAIIIAGLIVLLAVAGLAEALSHRRHLARIPLRIHVNGTRGKSSVTRLVAAGLRAGGIRTIAKTTGTLPRLILPDATEAPIERRSRPNVIEQRSVVRTAARHGAEAIVLECMALQPRLQWLCEAKLVRATHAIITNGRADHLDVMGPTEADVAWALANMTPPGGRLYTAEHRHLDVFRRAAADRGAALTAVTPQQVEEVAATDMAGFAYLEHAENVALALRVCEDVGVDRATALEGMQRAAPDPGATTIHHVHLPGTSLIFVNAFAANDPQSTGVIWRQASERLFPEVAQRIALVNCRDDREDRSRQLGQAAANWHTADHVVVVGTGVKVFARSAAAAGLDPQRLVVAGDARIDEIFTIVRNLAQSSGLIVGMGNIGGRGLEIVNRLREQATNVPSVGQVIGLAEPVWRRGGTEAATSSPRRGIAGVSRNGSPSCNGHS